MQPASPNDSLVSMPPISPGLKTQLPSGYLCVCVLVRVCVCVYIPDIFMLGGDDLNSCPHGCLVVLLIADPPPQQPSPTHLSFL